MEKTSTSRQAVPASVSKAIITSNKDKSKTTNLINGLVRLMYYESILQDTIRSEVYFIPWKFPLSEIHIYVNLRSL